MVRTGHLGAAGTLGAAVAAMLAFGQLLAPPPASATAAGTQSAPAPRLPADERQVCPLSSQPGVMSCQSVVRIFSQPQLERAARAEGVSVATAISQYGYSPASLRSAYRLGYAAVHDGKGETVAIVDAHSNPDLAGNLAVYRRHFHLSACTEASGCLRIVNQVGEPAPLPSGSAEWGFEESLDLDVVSAICPNCRILLVEARNAVIANLAVAEKTAAASGARFISNSWSGGEFVRETSYDKYFSYPGDAVTFAAGDIGMASLYPTSSQYVTAVGGTTLRRDKSAKRGWIETVWGSSGPVSRVGNPFLPGTGGGCSALEPKPSWQRGRVDDSATGCLNRTENDVSADANPATGVAMYDTYADHFNGGVPWQEVGGTSVATPIIAATYALAGKPAPRTYPASYLYRHPGGLFDVTSGTNGDCEPTRRYLCHAQRGYDGPTGLGTPAGPSAFADDGARPVTLADPGTQDVEAGAAFSLRITGLDAGPQPARLTYRATGLPAGLSIRPVAGTADAVISGTLPATAATRLVTVTARDAATRQAGSVRFMIVSVASLTVPGARAGKLSLHDGTLCLDAGSDSAGSAATVEHCTGAAGQDWSFAAGGAPGGPGTLSAGSMCLGRTGSALALSPCQPGSISQEWLPAAYGLLRSARASGCLAAGRMSAGEPVEVAPCSRAVTMRWSMPAGLLVSGVAGLCAEAPGGNDIPAPVGVVGCDPSAETEMLAVHADGSLQAKPYCLDVLGPDLLGSSLDGQAVSQTFCGVQEDQGQIWLVGPGGELINDFSGKCLAVPASGGSGTTLVQEDCYGLPGEIWALN